MFKLMITLWRHASWLQRMFVVSTALCCVAAVTNGFVPVGVTVGLILPALVAQLVGVLILQRQVRAWDDEDDS